MERIRGRRFFKTIIGGIVMKLKEAIKILKRSSEFHLQVDREPNKFDIAIKTVLQELEEATEDRDMYLRQLNRVFDNGFISKKKIEDKIEEIINNREEVGGETIVIQVLQELLEEK